MKTSAEQIFDNLEFLYENIYNLLLGFQQATNTNLSTVTVPIKNRDGVVELLPINSFQKILNELSRIDNNFKSLLNEDNVSYILSNDGSLGQITKTSFINAEYLENFSFGTTNENAQDTDENINCIVDTTSTLKNMVFPNVKIPIIINSEIKTDINCLIYKISEGFDKIPDNPTLIQLKYLISQGTIIAEEHNLSLKLQKEKVKYFGKFTVTDVQTNGNVVNLILSDVKYSGLNSIGNAINLKVNDTLVTSNGMAKFIIDEIDILSKKLKLTRVAGSENISVGIDKLFFNEIIDNDTNIVGVPVQPKEKLVVFLSTENLKTISFPSEGIKLNTETYMVTHEDSSYTLDEFFDKFVTNFYEYLYAIIKESSIPYSLGITPEKPVLNPANFSVIQINRHLTTSKSAQEIEELNTQKEKIKNNLDYNKVLMYQTQNEIDTLKFKSGEEKKYRLDKLTELKNERNILETNLLTVSRNLDSNAIDSGLKTIKPKYRLIGSWEIQPPIYSPLTKAQNIIKYEIQYRYLSKNVDTVENTSMKMINNGKEVSVTYSSWNNLDSRILKKVLNSDGSLSWEVPVLDSVDDININQLSIPITDGESIEVRVRALSEAGYPLSPKMSDWSEIMRYDFPSNLTESNISTIVSKNEIDLKNSEFNDTLKTSGILNHISGQIQEAEKLFFHKSEDIASGFYTPEQKNISLFAFLKSLQGDINILKNLEALNNITIQLVDFNSETFTILNNTTMDINAGNYSDNLNLLDSSKWGTIIRKQAFIKIKNNNQLPIELKTLVPGTEFNNVTATNYFNVPVKTPTGLIQNTRQVVYFRNVDITGQNEEIFKLIKPRLTPSNTVVNPLYIDSSAIENDKNIVYLDSDGNVKRCKLVPNAGNDFIAFTSEHPSFNVESMNDLIPNFERLKLFTETLKEKQYQEEIDNTSTQGLGFLDEDFYAVGKNSCGAFLYPIIANPNSISVVGNTVVSTLIVPKESELIIPVIYEYRMMDRIGKVNGENDTTINDAISYSKKIGIDLMINNELFKFDINVSSNLKSTVTPLENLNITSVVGNFGNEPEENLN